MIKKTNTLTTLIITLLIILTLIITIIPTNAQEPQITVNGYIYIDNIKTKPEEVGLGLLNGMIYATLHDDGEYEFTFSDATPGYRAKFRIVYQTKSYAPQEILTIEEGVYNYNIDLYIQTTDDNEDDQEINLPPVADASGPYYEVKDAPITFNGSGSNDSDGIIESFEWDFGDGTTATGISPTHIYQEVGKYTTILTITDDEGDTDLDITYAYITETPNEPPSRPITSGPSNGSVNSQINYTFTSTDRDNDTIQYIIDWGDETDLTSSHFLANFTTYSANHTWSYPGIYKLTTYVIDENDVSSLEIILTILIDAIYCNDIGHMTDYTSDSIYDLFYSNATGEETPVDFVDDVYLIDDDNDGRYDYQFDILTFNVSTHVEPESSEEKEGSLMDKLLPIAPYILIGIMILVIILILYFTFKIIRIPKKKKVKKEKEKKEKEVKEKETKKEIKKKEKTPKKEKPAPKPKAKKVEDEVDELLSKKKK